MHVIVAYDATPDEQTRLRHRLERSLHRAQRSLFAGELTRAQAERLRDDLRALAHKSSVAIWLYPSRPEILTMGTQADTSSRFA